MDDFVVLLQLEGQQVPVVVVVVHAVVPCWVGSFYYGELNEDYLLIFLSIYLSTYVCINQ